MRAYATTGLNTEILKPPTLIASMEWISENGNRVFSTSHPFSRAWKPRNTLDLGSAFMPQQGHCLPSSLTPLLAGASFFDGGTKKRTKAGFPFGSQEERGSPQHLPWTRFFPICAFHLNGWKHKLSNSRLTLKLPTEQKTPAQA